MSKDEYLKKCYEASKMQNVVGNALVSHKGTNYIPFALEISYKNGVAIVRAVLGDLKAYSVAYANLQDVEEAVEDETD